MHVRALRRFRRQRQGCRRLAAIRGSSPDKDAFSACIYGHRIAIWSDTALALWKLGIRAPIDGLKAAIYGDDWPEFRGPR
eukprot:3531-Rhodomonas_salina.2